MELGTPVSEPLGPSTSHKANAIRSAQQNIHLVVTLIASIVKDPDKGHDSCHRIRSSHKGTENLRATICALHPTLPTRTQKQEGANLNLLDSKSDYSTRKG